jgi:nucleotide-binding universal stress UspA family protein
VSVVELSGKDELAAARTHVKDVAVWLKSHGVVAKAIAARSNGDDAAHLNAIAREQHAGIVVAGAYGHSRLREYVLGGVTRELLRCAERCSFMSH